MAQDHTTTLFAILTDTFAVPVDELTPSATFESLGLDSLDLVEITLILDEQLGVKLEDADLEDIVTLADAIAAIDAKQVLA